MAYQINGNVIIDDSGDVSLTNFPSILKPVNLEPADTSSFYGSNITLSLTGFSGIYNLHSNTRFEVSNSAGFESANIVFDSGNIFASNVYYWTENVAADTFYWRASYLDNEGSVITSDATSFEILGLVAPPDGIGCPYQGGYFYGNIDIGGGVCYHIILAPNSGGCSIGQKWKNVQTVTGGTTTADGFFNTCSVLTAGGVHPAALWAAGVTVNDYSDWYLPSKDEIGPWLSIQASLPAGEGFKTGSINTAYYWSSTEQTGHEAWSVRFYGGGQQAGLVKNFANSNRAIRRIPKVG